MSFKAYETSSAQKRLYIINHLLGDSLLYNENRVWNINGKLNHNRLKKALAQLSLRHEILRTCFVMKDGEVLQKVYDHIDVAFTYTQNETIEPTPEDIEALIDHFLKPFDLINAPLWKVELVQWQGNRQSILMDFHHIIADGISMDLIMEELGNIYLGVELPGPEVQYVDFAIWQNDFFKEEGIIKQEAFWLQLFAGEIPQLDLPTDFPRPLAVDIAGTSVEFEMAEVLTARLNKLAAQNNTTLYVVLSSVFNILIAKYAAQEDIVVGTPVSGRPLREFENVIGMFVNTLAMRNWPAAGKTFKEFLNEVSRNAFNAFENQDYQFEMLVEKVTHNRQINRNPLFDVMFALQNFSQDIDLSTSDNSNNGGKEEVQLIPYHYKRRASKFDLTLQAFEEGRHILFILDYRTCLFRPETIDRLITNFLNIFNEVTENPGILLAGIRVISEAEREQLLYEFNDTKVDFPVAKTIPQLFEEQVERFPDHIALVGADLRVCPSLPVPPVPPVHPVRLTYRQLNEQSGRLAQVLNEKGILADNIIAIMVDRSIDTITAIMGILKSGAAYLPIDPDYPQERIDYMLKDSKAKIIIGSRHSCSEELNCQLSIVNCELLMGSPQASFHHSSHLSYIIYTSGSTGRPKGVMVEHRNVINLVCGLNERIYARYKRNLQVALVAPYIFDASVKQIFAALLLGHSLYIVPEDTRFDGVKLFAFYRKYAIDVSDGTPTHLRLLLESPGTQSQELNVKNFLIGGEPLTWKIVDKLFNHFETHSLKITNVYGPTECCVDSATYEIPEKNIGCRANPPIGIPMPNQQVYIVARSNNLQPIGIPGELCIGGNSVARGYLNNPELTAEKFSNFHHSSFIIHHSNLYRTGDLARWLPDGNIEYLGRMDHQVKLRGYRIETGEIENLLLNYHKIKGAVVLAREDDGGESYLCAYIVAAGDASFGESHPEALTKELKTYLAGMLPDYMIPSYFVLLEKIPVTPQGKVDRKSLPEPGKRSTVAYTAPRNMIDEKLIKIWGEVLNLKSIGIDDNFFESGGHSLKAAVMIARIHKELDALISLADIFKMSTIREISDYIKKAAKDVLTPIELVEKKEYYPLSPAQNRMYLLQQIEPGGTVYNIPLILDLKEKVNKKKLEETFRSLINRHESLRTSFQFIGSEPVQRIHDEVEFNIEIVERKAFIRPFDLSRAPLLRVGLIKEAEEKNGHILMLDMHHIITDGNSQVVLENEFMALYMGEVLAPLRIQYKDYTLWQRGEKEINRVKEQELYWLQEFAAGIPVLALPIDYPRPLVQSFAGSRIVFAISWAETAELKKLASTDNTTLFMVLLAIFNIVLSKLSGQEDIIVGTAAAGRRHAELQSLIGMFVNTLALRNYPSGKKNITDFIGEVANRSLEAFENQEYPFEELVDKLSIRRDTGRNPLFDVMLVLQNMATSEVEHPDFFKQKTCEIENDVSRFDMTWLGVEVGEELFFTCEYGTKLFTEASVKRFAGYFKNALAFVLENPVARLEDVEILSKEEKYQLLVEFNRTDTQYPKHKTIPELFEEQASKTPDSISVLPVQLVHRVRPVQLSYRQLNEQSDRLASLLSKKGVLPDSIVGIMPERSIEMIIGILGILKSGGAYLPIDPDYPQERIDYMLKDSNAKILINKSEIRNPKSETNPNGKNSNDQNENHNFRAALAYIIYTSGSTGKPKGVMVEHHNVVRLVKNTNFVEFKEKERLLQTGALEFDASTFEIWGSLLNGMTLCICDKDEILNPVKLKENIQKYDISTMWLTAPLFNQLSGVDVEIFAGLRNLLVGGDVLSPLHINPVMRRFPQLNIINGYGPTENTTFSTTFRIDKAYNQRIPIGKPIANSAAYVVDKSAHLVPVGVSGELLVGGDGVSRGYLNNPELTAEKFIDFHHSSFIIHHLKLYRTGDLVRWQEGGTIDFIGRKDQQVKIRGFRIEVEEIEAALLKHDLVKEAVVIDRKEENGEKYLCSYIVVTEDFDLKGLKEFLAESLPGYMIPTYFVRIKTIPLNSNGKLDRKALPEPELKREKEYEPPENEIEKKLAGVWSEVLSVEKNNIGMNDNFFELGGHSLKAAVLTTKIHKVFDVKIPLSEIFLLPTVRELAQYLKKSALDKYAAVEQVEKKEYYALSSAQGRLYILRQMNPLSMVYNMPQTIVLDAVNKEKLEETFKGLIRRHESLRTSFIVVNERPVQKIHDKVEFEIEIAGMGVQENGVRIEKIVQDFVKPFDLSHAPLLRVSLMKVEKEKYVLLVDMHHIISDGVSQGILVKEFEALYNGGPLPVLPPLRLQYKDYSEWQNSISYREILNRQEQYWLEYLSGELPVLNLPYDYTRPEVQSFAGNCKNFSLGRKETASIKDLAAGIGGTLYMVLLGIFNLLLARLSGLEDIIVGSPLAGRSHADLQQIIGMFVNTLAIRNHPSGEKSVAGFLQEVKTRALKAFENQDYPFENLVAVAAAVRDVGRNPIFDVVFALQNLAEQGNWLESSDYAYESKIAKFDMTLSAAETGESLIFSLEYCSRLFKAETIDHFIAYFKYIVYSIIENPWQRICDIEMLSDAEKRQLLVEFNDTGEPYPNDKTIPGLFALQVARTPDNIAVSENQQATLHQLSYRELNEISGHLAHYLRQRGARENELVGLLVNRSLEMIIGILGILKAGCGYVPLNPKAPEARSEYMLEECHAGILLTTRLILNHSHLHAVSPSYHAHHVNPANFAYVIFTSGSTGKPKGVPITHSNLCPLLHWGYRSLGLGSKDRFLQNLSYYFDWSVWEIVIALTTGAGLYMVPDELLLNPEASVAFLNRSDITVLHVTPTQYRYYLKAVEKPGTLKYLFIGAEKLSLELVQRSFASVDENCRVFNMYGPTECTIISAVLEIKRSDVEKFTYLSSIPIGKAVGNIDLFVLDKYLNVCPANVWGELYITGDCAAWGYLNNPELTAEKFNRSDKSYLSSIFYKTGDLARRLQDGNIEFIGRIDQQVKIRGFRIELGEIESELVKHALVKEAVVIDREGETGETYLCGYIVMAEKFELLVLKEFLSKRLPNYMVPSYFIGIESIPLNPNGKVDRKALPEPGITSGEDFMPPGNEIEEKVAVIWSEVLEIEKSKLSVNADFFDLGGHSLKATVMVAKIHKVFDLKLQLIQVFTSPTIRGIASLIEAMNWLKIGKSKEPTIYINAGQESEEIIL